MYKEIRVIIVEAILESFSGETLGVTSEDILKKSPFCFFFISDFKAHQDDNKIETLL